MSEAIVSATVGMLGDLLKEEVTFLSGVRHQVHDLQAKLQEIQCFLKDADKKQYESETVRNWVRSIKNLAYRTENVLEIYAIKVESRKGKGIKKTLRRFACIFDEGITLHKVGVEIGKIKNEVSSLMERVETHEVTLDKEAKSSATATKDLLKQTFAHEIEDDFVGMENDLDRLLSLMTDRDSDHRIISIYGMGGSGKTTLAKQVFNHKHVQNRFESFAWVTVSQQLKAESLLQEILRQLDPRRKKDDIKQMEYRELVEELCKVQTEKQWLVVLDDVWKREDWTVLGRAFPIAEIDCKVLLTTRIQGVAKIGISHKLNLFSEDEGWQLLKKKALTSTNAIDSDVQAKHEKLGKQIVRKCDFLPLAISVIGGILSKKETLAEWETVNRDIDSYLRYGEGGEDTKQVMQILTFSYEDLPFHLKPCFLYFAYYPEDSRIDVQTLYWMWIAEDMVSSEDQGTNETLVEVAKRYLSELASRSLVQLESARSSIGNSHQVCRLHDLMHELCLWKCKEEDFLKVMDFRGAKQPTSNLNSPGGNAYRLAIHGSTDENVGDRILQEANEGTRLYSLRSFDYPRTACKVSNDLGKLRFLRVVAFEGLKFSNTKLLHKIIKKLIHLRFLSFQECELDEVPSSVGKLTYLQTFYLVVPFTVKIPDVFWKLKRLRHLVLESDRDDRSEGKLRLDCLSGLETLIDHNPYSIEVNVLPNLTNLRVLHSDVKNNERLSAIISCIEVNWCNIQEIQLRICDDCDFVSSPDGSILLHKLFMCRAIQRLRIEAPISELPRYESGMLASSDLVDLCMIDCSIREDPMPTLEKLPKLKRLELVYRSFDGEELVCSSNGFPNLTDLAFKHLPNLRKWRIDGGMPKLSSVSIKWCSKMEMIPDGMKFLKTLRNLRTFNMPKDFNNRMRIVNGEEGADFHKVCHVPFISLEGELKGENLRQEPPRWLWSLFLD